jgi:hypothetical protein
VSSTEARPRPVEAAAASPTTDEDVRARLRERADALARAQAIASAVYRLRDDVDYADTYAEATADTSAARFRDLTGRWPCDCESDCKCIGATAAKITAERKTP